MSITRNQVSLPPDARLHVNALETIDLQVKLQFVIIFSSLLFLNAQDILSFLLTNKTISGFGRSKFSFRFVQIFV